MSETQEIGIGRQYHPQVLQQYGEYEQAELQRYVQAVGERLAAKSHRQDLIYRFTLLDSTEVNAFALPGGYIYITRGLIGYMKSEEELAAVLGHEIGHVTARHAVRQQTAATAANLAYTLGSVFVPQLGGDLAQNMYGALSGAMLSGYGREMELEADGLGADYLVATGYDSRAILGVLATLKAQEQFAAEQAKAEGREPQSYHGLFASHPDNDTRLQEVVGKASFHALDDATPKQLSGDFRKLTEGMVFGDSPAQGIRRGNKFYHADMGFAIGFPAGWTIKNLPDRVLAVAPGGSAGAELQMQDRNKRIPPNQFLTEHLGVTSLRAGAQIQPDGLEGYSGIADLRTAAGKVAGRVSVIYLNGSAYTLVGAPMSKQAPADLLDKLLDAANSFHRLTEEERKLAQPLRINWQRAQAGTTYAKLAAKSAIPGYAEAELRLLNGQYPTGEPVAGGWIKVVH